MGRKKNETKASRKISYEPEQIEIDERNFSGGEVVWGFVFIFIGIVTALGYFSNEGFIIDVFCKLFKGMFGWGFYFIPPVIIAAGYIMIFRRDCSRLKFTALCLFPLIICIFYHLVAVKTTYELSSWSVFVYLWHDGIECASGGVIGGLIALLLTMLLSKVGAFIIGLILVLGDIYIMFREFFLKKFLTYREYLAVKIAERKNMDEFDEKERRTKEKHDKIANKRKAKQQTAELPKIEADDETEIKPSFRVNRKKLSYDQDNNDDDNDIVIEGIDDAEVPIEIPELKEPPKRRKRFDREELVQEFTEDMEAQTEHPEYKFPPIDMLSTDSANNKRDPRDEIMKNRERLEDALASFGVHASVSNIVRGPAVTRYEVELEAGIKLNKLTNLADDIALSLGVAGVRIAAIPDKRSTVGIEVPNRNISTVYLRDIIDTGEFRSAESKLSFALGKNIGGEAIVGNIAKLPHLLVAGTTGSGKSVCLNSLILSILYKATPDEVKFIMIDPKMVEFKIYNGIPHLLVPVVTEAKKAAGALQWAVTEMMKRYSIFSETGARDLKSYNAIATRNDDMSPMPQIVVVIDELADLMLVAAKEVEESICRVAQMGRAAGVHLVIATQSPRADVITGLMKANIPSRISFKVASSLESRIILDSAGSADKLMGNGDMLYAPIASSKPLRVQGTWVTDEERENILNYIKQDSKAEYSEDVLNQIENAAIGKKPSFDDSADDNGMDDVDELYPQAVEVILESGQASVSYLQRRLKVGYARAARLVDQMEEKGVVGPFEGAKPRQLLITRQQWQEMQTSSNPAMDNAQMEIEYSRKEADFDDYFE